MAGDEFVAVQHMLPRRPVHRLHHKRPEPAAAFLQPLDALNAVIGRADNPGAPLRHHINDLLRRPVHHPGPPHGVLKVFPLVAAGANARLLKSLLAGVGQMNGQHQPPFKAIHRLVMFRRRFLADVPQLLQIGALRHLGIPGRGDGQHRRPVLAGQRHARRRLHRGHRNGHMRRLVRAQLQHRFLQHEPVAFVGNRLLFGEQAHNHAQGFVHPQPLLGGVNAHHIGVAGQRAGANAQHHPPPGHMVQLRHPVGDHKGMVIGQADHAGAQLDVLGAVGGHADKNLRRGDDFPAGAVVFPNPGFVKAQIVQPLHQLQVAFQRQGRVFARPVERAHKDAELHTVG